MSNEITRANGLPANLTEAINMGKMFFDSGLFADIKSAAQAVVKIQAGAELGIPAFASLSGIHIIQGKPTIGSGLMAGRIKASGKYDYKVIQQDDKLCSIDFYQGKEKLGNSTFTLVDAQKAGTKNIDKFPRNMLFARAISNGVKWYCPDVFAGPVYTPEEMNEIPVVTEDVPHEEVPPPAPAKKPITDKAFAQAISRIKGGEVMLVNKITEAYALTPEQAATLEDTINNPETETV